MRGFGSRAKHRAPLLVKICRVSKTHPDHYLTYMKNHLLNLLILSLALFSASDGFARQQKQEDKKPAEKAPAEQAKKEPQAKNEPQQAADKSNEPACVLSDIEMKNIDGKAVSLKKYEGKVLLIVNVASKCGFTGQYRPLQALHKQYNKHGLEVIAFPCDQFGGQELEKESAISDFCKKKFGIQFDMYSKVKVKGEQKAELFKRLTKCNLAPAGQGEVRWNFEKFLVGKDGKPLARFRSNVAPDDDAIVSKLRAALGIEEEKNKPDSKPQPKDTKAAEKTPEKIKASKVNVDKKS